MAKRERGLTTLQIVVDVITAPMTRGDITQAVGMAESTVDLHLRTALDWGLVTRTKCKNVYIWEQRAVAAE
jgi:DNA-binding transcriptional regulator GbsR (MarR family)